MKGKRNIPVNHHANRAMRRKQNRMPEGANNAMEVHNEKLVELLDACTADKESAEKLNQMISELVRTRGLVPSQIVEKDGKKMPSPLMLKAENLDGFVLPYFTDGEHLKKAPKSQAVVNLPYLALNQTALTGQAENIKGIVINPYAHDVFLNLKMIGRIAEVEKAKNPSVCEDPDGERTLKLSEEQYMSFERRRFELLNLPKKLYEAGDEWIAGLLEKREEYLDSYYEECFQEKRMYPYLPEDFQIMPMQINDDVTLLRVEMPKNDIQPGLAERAFLIWDRKKKEGHYFLLDATKESGKLQLTEVKPDLKHVSHGLVDEENTLLHRLLEMSGVR